MVKIGKPSLMIERRGQRGGCYTQNIEMQALILGNASSMANIYRTHVSSCFPEMIPV